MRPEGEGSVASGVNIDGVEVMIAEVFWLDTRDQIWERKAVEELDSNFQRDRLSSKMPNTSQRILSIVTFESRFWMCSYLQRR